jgi:hypothetical protein
MAANVAAGGLRGLIVPFAGTGFFTVFGAGPVFIVSFILISIAFLAAGKLIKDRG